MPDARDIRDNLTELRDAINAHLAQADADEWLAVIADRMVSHLIATSSPAALAVAEAVGKHRKRFEDSFERRLAKLTAQLNPDQSQHQTPPDPDASGEGQPTAPRRTRARPTIAQPRRIRADEAD